MLHTFTFYYSPFIVVFQCDGGALEKQDPDESRDIGTIDHSAFTIHNSLLTTHNLPFTS